MTLARISSRARSEGTIRPRATDARKLAFHVSWPNSKQSRSPINSDQTRASNVGGLSMNQGACPMIKAEGRDPASEGRAATRKVSPREVDRHELQSCTCVCPVNTPRSREGRSQT